MESKPIILAVYLNESKTYYYNKFYLKFKGTLKCHELFIVFGQLLNQIIKCNFKNSSN